MHWASRLTEYDGARFLAGQFLQLTGHNLAHATKPFDVPGTFHQRKMSFSAYCYD
jgi:hypothetical protein